jgi:hypothetical protein
MLNHLKLKHLHSFEHVTVPKGRKKPSPPALHMHVVQETFSCGLLQHHSFTILYFIIVMTTVGVSRPGGPRADE